ncbi:expressed unknown protein [Seminavis robusta]|uniref:Uncharacterized protein n=1 Tax=Seminavis robusta TaxID=568900 RepID=A0A9N8DCP4_9STRA|nr:expressed unknown protein [Seminavis robusta]|eukprot:Sro31_g020210.1 n/a (162) ;mRNA; r:63464-63949
MGNANSTAMIRKSLVLRQKKGQLMTEQPATANDQVPSVVKPQHLLAALERYGESNPEELIMMGLSGKSTETRRTSATDWEDSARTASSRSTDNAMPFEDDMMGTMEPQEILRMLENYGTAGHASSADAANKYLQMAKVLQECDMDEEHDDISSLVDMATGW